MPPRLAKYCELKVSFTHQPNAVPTRRPQTTHKMFKYNADLYRHVTKYPRQVAKDIIGEFSQRFKFRPDGRDSLLDIGCGPGDITGDYILPVLPKQFSRIVGSDVSESMLSEARNRIQHPNASFQLLDIMKPVDKKIWSKPFDHVTSFFCLQFQRDEAQTFRNIHDLMVDGGDCLLLILDRNTAYDIVYQVAKSPRWAPYLKDIDNILPYYQFVFDPVADIKKTMSTIGFSEYDVEQRDSFALHQSVNDLKGKNQIASTSSTN